MKISKVRVDGLFGIFDHEIPLNLREHITIMHGPNGYGKTVILNMINSLYSRRYLELRRIPFRRFSIQYNDKSNLRITPVKNTKDKGDLIFAYKRPKAKTLTFELNLKIKNRHEMHFPLSIISREIPELERVAPEIWIHSVTNEKLYLPEVMDRYRDRLPFLVEKIGREHDWLLELLKSLDVHFIETQRLYRYQQKKDRSEYSEKTTATPTVTKYANEIALAVQAKLAEYGALSQSMDRTFPLRLVVDNKKREPSIETLKDKLEQLEQKRSKLMASGLLDKENEINFNTLPSINDLNRNVLAVYVEDAETKLNVFDELTSKIDILSKIINDRFLHKSMQISKTDGIVFRSPDGKTLQPTSLSSGEQHEMVMLYELLFKIGPNSLILIDEPELSLHVAWQQQFLQDLQKITKITGIDVLIATHSPQIIHDRWDLTIELKGPDNNAKTSNSG
jgi:predicted ATP-binding protein involved in virulence